ncbi:MAG: helix-turn-helix transcriptional regulator, partial [Ruminococcus sp.]|nr:helix-turn-helix transcriptional regulator [Ruminococcus sp.]
MNISCAVAERILELCKAKGLTVNKLSTISGVTQSTVNDIVNHKAKNIGIVTIKKLCDGL